MTRRQIETRINEMLDEYAYAGTWPLMCQQEYEQLCALLYPKTATGRRPTLVRVRDWRKLTIT
jgi:hypothetical protein